MTDRPEASRPAEPPVIPFEAVIEAAADAVIVTDGTLAMPGPAIVYVNPAFSRMTGYGADEVVGRTPRLLQGPHTDREELGRMRASLLAGRAYRGQSVNHRKDGDRYLVDGIIAPVRRADGTIVRWFSIQRDVTAEQDARDRLRRDADALEHRARTVLASVRSLASRTAEASRSLEDCAMHLDGRIGALGRVQAALLRAPGAGVDLATLLADELQAHAAREGEGVSLAGPPLRLTPRAAETLGLAAHELAANAVKFGALAAGAGRLAVSWRVEDGTEGPGLVLVWKESGLAGIGAPSCAGFGTDQLGRALPQEIGALARCDYEPDGLRCTIRAPLDARVLWPGAGPGPG